MRIYFILFEARDLSKASSTSTVVSRAQSTLYWPEAAFFMYCLSHHHGSMLGIDQKSRVTLFIFILNLQNMPQYALCIPNSPSDR